MKTLIKANLEAVDQALYTIESLSDDQYGARVGGRSQPGSHIRHILDHYHSVREGLLSGTVDYDMRRRNCAAESDRAAATLDLNAIKQWLRSVSETPRPLSVKSEVSVCECHTVSINSDSQRELLYVLNHTIHHMAYVSLLLQANGVKLKREIGLAPATATHLRSVTAS